MIEIENHNNRNLKNVKQIGTPREENKIYIENSSYNKIKEGYQERRVFVLMGHTERAEGRYATFVEAVIPVNEIEFSAGVPRWNNAAWSQVFREIKRLYEDMIIVGWALDIRGMSPKMTPDLERVHREHFGGVHQLIFLLDTLEQEETFYIYKENKLVSKDGFYIYHKARAKTVPSEKEHAKKDYSVRRMEPRVDVEVEMPQSQTQRGGKYRQFIQEKETPKKDGGNMGMAMAVAMLVFVIGVGVYENSGVMLEKPSSVETNLLQNQDDQNQSDKEASGEVVNEPDTETVAEDTQEASNIIEVEVISGSE